MDLAAIFMLLTLVIMMVIGMPITWSLGGAIIMALMIDQDLSLALITQKMFSGCDNFSMLALPAFFLAGDIMAKGGLSRRLVAFADTLVGWISGGISLVSIVACTFFAAISGSSVATTAAIGGLMYPEMVKRGYPKDYSAAVQAIGGTLGIVIPPSTVFVIYGNITNTSVAKLLMAGVIPGVICGIALCVWAYIKARRENFPRSAEGFSFVRFLKSFKSAVWALLMPIVILGGIYAGIFTPTEAASVAAIYAFVCGFFFHRELSIIKFLKAVATSCSTTATTMVILGCASAFTKIIMVEQIPALITNGFLSLTSNGVVLLILINILLLIVGCFMDTTPAILVLAPILMPIAKTIGLDPVHFGLIMVVNLAIGFTTPPLGINLFVASRISNSPMEVILKGIVPFLIIMIINLLIISFIPQIVMFLPNL